MEAEEAVEVDGCIGAAVGCRGGTRYGDGGAEVVVGLFAVGHDHVEAVGGAPLKDGNQNLLAGRRCVGGVQGALEPEGGGTHSHHRQCRVAEKESACGHKVSTSF